MTFRQIQPHSADYAAALRLRGDVLRTPLGLTLTPEDLAQDLACFHFGGFEETRLLATLLLQPIDGQELQMRQVAVCPERQRTGLGTQLIAFAESFARDRGYRTIFAHARDTAVEFYQGLGYAAVGAMFVEQTIPHRLVVKTL